MTIRITVQEQSIRIGSAIPVGSGEANDAANVGAGAGVFRDKVGATINLKSITGSSGVVITDGADEIDIAGPSSLGDVVGPASSTANAAVQFDGITGKLIKDPDAAFDMGGQAITNVGNVDGRDVSADGTAADAHIADTANPHGTTAAQTGADPAGTGAAAVVAHEAAGDPHPQYTTDIEAAALAPVQSVNAFVGAVVLGASDVGADPTGTATVAVANHEAAPDPHPTYTTAAEAALAAPVQDVNGETGNVVLDAVDVGADPTGTASAAVSLHETSFDHPSIPTSAQKAALDAASAPSGGNPVATIADLPAASSGDVVGPASAGDTNFAAFDGATGKLIADSGTKASDFVSITDLNNHVTDTGNPHVVTAAQVNAIPTAEKAAVNGVATLDGAGLVPSSQIPPLAITETYVVVDEPARLALSVQIGDVCVQTDVGRTYILRVTPPSSPGAWEEIVAPGTGVTSVNGDPGPVVALTTDDVPEGATNQYHTQVRVSANGDVANNTAHVAISPGNPHGTRVADLTAGTLAELNTKVTDATLDDAGDSRPPNGAASGDLAGAYPSPTIPHISDTANPHATDIGNLGTGTLAELNVAVSDATLDDATSPRTPSAHSLGGAEHSADTLANLNAKVTDATLDDATGSRPPSGAAGGDLTGSSYPNPTVAANAITNAKMAIMAANTIKARAGSSPAVPGDLVIANGNIPIRPAGANLQSGTPAQVRTLINVEDGATNTPLTSATPADVTDSTGSVGTGTDVARDDHAHAHGNRGGGSLHAVATTLVAGFMSAADKTNLDTITPGNFFPVKQAGATNLIYVRTTGNDTTGDGTLGTPYRTIARALEDVPFMIYGETYVIECTGLGQELVTTPLVIPPIYSPDAAVFGSTRVAGFTISRALTIEAAPTVLDTITAPEITGQTSNATTNLKTLQTTKSYTLDQYRGKLVRDATNKVAVIASNTAGPNSDIEVTEQSALTAPIEILDQSAEIRNSDAGGSNALEIRNLLAGVQLNGIKLTTANPSSFRYGLFLDNHVGAFGATGCDIDGFFAALGTVQPSLAGTNIVKRFAATGVAANLFSCFVDSATVAFRNGGLSTDAAFWFENIFDGCSPIGAGTGIEDINSVVVSMDRCGVRNGTGDGIQVVPGGRFVVRRSELNNNAGNGMAVRGSGLSVLRDSQGTGNTGLGLQLTNGAVVQRVGASAPTGTGGDYQVGGNTAGTWGGFSGDENDLGATTPQICRLYV